MIRLRFIIILSCFITTTCFISIPKLSNVQTTTKLYLQGSYLVSLTKTANLSPEKIFPNDPYAPDVAKKYGLACSTPADGFDAAADAVGPSIYGGSVKRDENGLILRSSQYEENDHHRPGPLYDGNGYSLMSRAIHVGPDKVTELLNDYPQLVEEVSTGGATPLHVCGMSEKGQHCTQALINAGADPHALDGYNYNPLHRMASNDLEIGAEVLVKAGINPNEKSDEADSTPIEIARRQRAIKFLMAMQRLGHYD